jgi:hypothetical protein
VAVVNLWLVLLLWGAAISSTMWVCIFFLEAWCACSLCVWWCCVEVLVFCIGVHVAALQPLRPSLLVPALVPCVRAPRVPCTRCLV